MFTQQCMVLKQQRCSAEICKHLSKINTTANNRTSETLITVYYRAELQNMTLKILLSMKHSQSHP